MHSSIPRRILTGSIVSLLATFASIPSTAKADATWVGDTSADWNNAANWDSDPANPSGNFNINGAGITPVLNANSLFSPVDIKVGTGATGRLNHTAGTLSAGGGNWSFIGQGGGGNGTYNLADTTASGGTLTGFGTGSGSFNTTRLYVADGGSSVGTMAINTTGTVTVSNDIYIGNNGTGVVKMDAGTLNRTGGWTVIGLGGAAGNGTLNMSGGLVTGSGDNIVGLDAGSTGALNMTGGTFTSGGWMQIGRNGANGTVTVNGASAILNANDQYRLGYGGSGTSSTTVSAGTLNVGNWLIVSQENTQATLTISGTGVVNQGLTDAGSRLEVTNPGSTGTGRVNLDGGTLNTNGFAVSGDAAATSIFNFNGGTLKPRANNGGFMGGLDRANVRNGGALIDTNGFDITIGQALLHSDIGGDNATDGGLTKSGNGTLALNSTASYTGATTISGGTLQLNVGSQPGTIGGDGAIIINSGGTLASANGATDATGYYNHTANNGITINEGGALMVRENGRMSMDRAINSVGGTITSTGTNFNNGASYSFRDFGGSGGNSNGTLNSYNFTSSAGGTASTISATHLGLAGQVTFNVTDGTGAVELNVTGDMVDNFGSGSLIKTGDGVMVIASTNTYTGPTSVNAGTLRVSGSIAGSSLTTVIGGTLSGTGTVGPLRLNGGTLAPGNSPGILTAGNTEFAGGTFALKLNGTSAGQFDQLNVGGTFSLTANTDITFALGYTPADSDSFIVMANDSTDAPTLNGFTFLYQGSPVVDDVPFGSFGGKQLVFDYNGGSDNNDFLLTVVPEPGSAMLLAFAGIGLAARRRRRK